MEIEPPDEDEALAVALRLIEKFGDDAAVVAQEMVDDYLADEDQSEFMRWCAIRNALAYTLSGSKTLH